MISEEKLATLRNVILCDVHETTWLEIMDTLSALWRVVRAAEIVAPMARGYAYEHPVGSNTEYANKLTASLAALREEEK